MEEERTVNERQACGSCGEMDARGGEKEREEPELGGSGRIPVEDGSFEGFEDERAENEAEADKTDAEVNEAESLKAQLAAARADLYNYRQRTERDRAKTRKLIS
ncbi:MAG: hypothetical protein LBS00_11305, partial [Synergistaceae bacterium]|nr:hypothetical protein [Synergistaceae bacterium]